MSKSSVLDEFEDVHIHGISSNERSALHLECLADFWKARTKHQTPEEERETELRLRSQHG